MNYVEICSHMKNNRNHIPDPEAHVWLGAIILSPPTSSDSCGFNPGNTMI